MNTKPTLQLTGTNGNVFAIIGAARKAARKAGMPPSEVAALVQDLMSAKSYDDVLQKVMAKFDVE